MKYDQFYCLLSDVSCKAVCQISAAEIHPINSFHREASLTSYAMQIDGNVWRVSSLGKAILAGMLLSLIPVISLFFFNDNRSLGLESEAHNASCARTEGMENGPHPLPIQQRLILCKFDPML